MEDFNKFLRKEAFKKSFGSLLESTENNSKLYENNIDFKFIKGEIIKDLKSDNVFIKSLKGEKGDRGEKGIDADNFRFGYGGDGALGYNQVVQEINNKLISYYDKNEINQILLSAADIDLTGYYTKNEVDNLTSGFLENIVEDLSPELGNNLSANNYDIVNVKNLQLTPYTSAYPTSIGSIFWDTQNRTISAILEKSTLQIGEEMYLLVINKTSASIPNGSVVYVNGTFNDRPTIELASTNSYNNARLTIGVTTQEIAKNDIGMVTILGVVHDLNTSTLTIGSLLYLSSAAGQYTQNIPPLGKAKIIVGIVARVHSSKGDILVKPVSDKYMFGDVDNGNYTMFETDGTITFKGNASVYNDIYVQIASGKSPAVNFPTWANFTTNTNSYQFAVNDNIDLSTIEMYHDWKEGSQIELHVHWSNTGTETSATYVKWRIYYTIAYNGTVFFDDLYIEKEFMISAGTVSRTSFMSSIGTIDMTGYPIGTQIKTKLMRVASSGLAPNLNPFAGMVGIHYEMDTVGSRNISTK